MGLLLMTDWAAIGGMLATIIGSISLATVAIINAVHGVRSQEQDHHVEASAKLETIQTQVNGNTKALLDKIPDAKTGSTP